MKDLNIPMLLESIAIVVVGYNRLPGLKRILSSVNDAFYPEEVNVPLVISIDASGNEDVYDYAQTFEWLHGDKYVNIEETRLGLKAHLFQCGDLSRFFKAVVILEDDLYVSRYFYNYVARTVEAYGDNPNIAQISLYKNECNGYAGLPFEPMQTGSDVYLMQDVSTWGQIFTRQMWDGFVSWRDSHTEEDIQNVDMTSHIKGWARAWSKYYNAYVVATNKYIVYPHIPVSTNFNDAGEHGSGNDSVFQVNLLQGKLDYSLPPFEDMVRYDTYFNNEATYKWLGVRKSELLLDYYGFHNDYRGQKYILSTRVLPNKIIRSFALSMRPIEANIKEDISGKGLFLYEANTEQKSISGTYNSLVPKYFLKSFNIRIIWKWVADYYMNAIKRKLFKK
ncbi:MAG: glycosyltransferase family 2 protein [Prevotella sp.]|nr:glycosyltransferase family 2 protein [Candidatus Equicola stercoris]